MYKSFCVFLCSVLFCFSAQTDKNSVSEKSDLFQYCLPADSNQCLILDSAGECVCDLQLFNSFAMITKPNNAIGIDSTRSLILDNCLYSIFFYRLANEHNYFYKGLQQNVTFFYNQMLQKNTTYQVKKRYSNEVLQDYFKNIYRKHNGTGTEIFFPVIISTDSMYIDSIYQALKSKTQITVKTQLSNTNDIDTLWTMLSERECPKEILKSINSHNDSTINKCNINGLGYVIFCGKRSSITKPIRFDDVRENLKKIAAINDTSLNEMCHQYYNNYSSFNSFNIFQNDSIRFWFFTKQQNSATQIPNNNDSIIIDTLQNKPFSTCLMDISSLLFNTIQRDSLYYTGHTKHVETSYGTFCYQRYGSLPLLRKKLFYSKVESELKVKFAFTPPPELEVKKDGITNAFKIMLTGQSFFDVYVKQQPEPSKQEIVDYIEKNNVLSRIDTTIIQNNDDLIKWAKYDLLYSKAVMQLKQWQLNLKKTDQFYRFLD